MTTTLAHHPTCPKSQMWDIEGVECRCPIFWPQRVCDTCWLPPTRHLKTCPHNPKKEDA